MANISLSNALPNDMEVAAHACQAPRIFVGDGRGIIYTLKALTRAGEAALRHFAGHVSS